MRFRSLLPLVLVVVCAAPLCAAAPMDLAEILWSKGYPKVVPSATTKGQSEVELYGTFRIKYPGWSIKDAQFTTTPRAGGTRSQPTKLHYFDGKWGARDPKNKLKVVPIRVPVEKGEWSTFVVFTLEGIDPATGRPTTVRWAAALKLLDVK
jgi:hypothetical protein